MAVQPPLSGVRDSFRSFLMMIPPFLTASVLFFFASVHVYYTIHVIFKGATVLLLFSGFILSFLATLVFFTVCVMQRPGPLPSRLTANRMEGFIKGELRRLLSKATAAGGGAAAPHGSARFNSNSASFHHESDTTPYTGAVITGDQTVAKGVGKATSPVPVTGGAAPAVSSTLLQEMDEAESLQRANAASSAALMERNSHRAEEQMLEQASANALLGNSSSSSDHDDETHADGSEDPHCREGQSSNRGAALRGGTADDADGLPDNGALGEQRSGLLLHMNDAMRRRRHRKLRRGLELVSVSRVANGILRAMEGDDLDAKQHEMSILVPGAPLCRFCQCYQMNETRHCAICGCCIYRMKLHCPALGHCIDIHSEKFYALFLLYVILSAILGATMDFYCVGMGYTRFFTPQGDVEGVYYLISIYTFSLIGILMAVFAQSIYSTGRGEGSVTQVLRETRENMERVQQRESGAGYQVLLSQVLPSEAEPTPQKFEWRRVTKMLGEGLSFPYWFLPIPTIPALSEMDDPPMFWVELQRAIRIRLRSVADEDDVFSDDEEEMDTGTTGVVVTATSPAEKAPCYAVSSVAST